MPGESNAAMAMAVELDGSFLTTREQRHVTASAKSEKTFLYSVAKSAKLHVLTWRPEAYTVWQSLQDFMSWLAHTWLRAFFRSRPLNHIMSHHSHSAPMTPQEGSWALRGRIDDLPLRPGACCGASDRGETETLKRLLRKDHPRPLQSKEAGDQARGRKGLQGPRKGREPYATRENPKSPEANPRKEDEEGIEEGSLAVSGASKAVPKVGGTDLEEGDEMRDGLPKGQLSSLLHSRDEVANGENTTAWRYL